MTPCSCQCKVLNEFHDGKWIDSTICYCPLHKAAEEMVKTLEQINQRVLLVGDYAELGTRISEALKSARGDK